MEHLRGRRKYNTYKHLGDGTTIIYTYRNEEIYIDTEDFNKVNNYCWCVDHVGNAVTNIYNDNGKKTVMRMARYILGVDKGYKVIHLDGCNNNNRKSNLVVIKNITFKSNSNTYIM
ncbi:MAG: hypothetical protein N3F09_11165, partial [Bacteroidia bacterium]|nr:hypothetical protein [Bacteroidia bacterium]